MSLILFIGMIAVITAKVLFHEEFNEDWESRWQKSEFKIEAQGIIERSKGRLAPQTDMAYGLRTIEDYKFYYISSRLATPIVTGNSSFVLQYSLKFEQAIECGGGYIKLIGADYKSEEFGTETPVMIMFGPDICGNDNKIHLMLNIDDRGILWNKAPTAPTDRMTHVYTMLMNPDKTYAVYVDMESVGNGTIDDDWDVAAPKMIPDSSDKKPKDWDDRIYIDDKDSVKPNDWVDEEMIEDPVAVKPENWDDAKDGKWSHPMVRNPAYKGRWLPKKIRNPDYKGVWTPRKIPNPDYADSLFKSLTIGGVGIDVWQVKHGTVFDNIMIADSLDDAFIEAKKIIEIQVPAEKALVEEEKKRDEARMEAVREAAKKRGEDIKILEFNQREDL